MVIAVWEIDWGNICLVKLRNGWCGFFVGVGVLLFLLVVLESSVGSFGRVLLFFSCLR